MAEAIEAVVIGAGQAGLAASHELSRREVPNVVFERGTVGQTWRGRWDSFCLVTPNWTVQMPGGEYDGPDPDGYLPRDEIVAHMERYAARNEAPVREGVEVTALEPRDDGFALKTSAGPLAARAVVVSTGAYQRPHRPACAAALPGDLFQIDADDYRNPADLPDGRVLVVGSGQTGCQISEELHQAGRDVFLACGRAPWIPRRLGEHDFVWWALETGFLDQPIDAIPGPAEKLVANVQASGHGGGHDLHYRTLHAMGVTLLGRLAGVQGRRALFAPDLADSVAFGDERREKLMGLVRKLVAERGLAMPEIPEPEPFAAPVIEEVDLSDFGAVIFTGGFRPDYSWISCPGAFDDMGFPLHNGEGASSAADGLYFVGVHFLRKRKSSLLVGVGEDAALVAGQVAERMRAGSRPSIRPAT